MPRKKAADADLAEQELPTAFWSGVITFGLVSVPVSLFAASRDNTPRLRMVDDEGTQLRRRYFSESGRKPLESEEIARGFETESGRFVLVEDEELESLAPEKSREIDLTRFVPVHDLSPVHFEKPYVLVPDGRSNKAYRLLAQTLEEEERAGIATFIMRDREYLCAIMAEKGVLTLETLRFQDEIRTPKMIGLPARKPADAKEVTQLTSAIRSLKAKTLDRTPLDDPLAERIVALAKRKLKSGKDVVESVEEEDDAEASATDVIDLVQVLKARLEGRDTQASPRPAATGNGASKVPSRAELYARAQKLDIPGRSTMSKDELARAVRQA
ncbi:MAG TPA: Ku protein [Gemmatimonadales bacterium]|nr:Ku protein [Gemmatimonadales bacterium]